MLLVQKYFLMLACMWENTGCITVLFRTCGWLCGAVVTGFRLSLPGAWLLFFASQPRNVLFCGCHSLPDVPAHPKLVMLGFLGGCGQPGSEPGRFLGAAACFHCHCPRSHLTGTSRPCSGEGLRDSGEWVRDCCPQSNSGGVCLVFAHL